MPRIIVPHCVRVAVLSCLEDRLVWADASYVQSQGGGFLARLAGGPAALLTRRDRESGTGQLVDAYGVEAYGRGILRLHLGCGKLALLTAKGGEMYSTFDPTSVESLYQLGDRTSEIAQNALFKAYHVVVPFEVQVLDIVPGPEGTPAGIIMRRPAPAPSSYAAFAE